MRPDDDPFDQGGDPTDPPGTTPINPLQRYNLQNQSWGLPRKDKTGTLTDPIKIFNDFYPNQIPSNSEVVWTGLQYQPVVGAADPYERIFPNLYRELLGNSPIAPKGFYIIDLLKRGDSREAEFALNYQRSYGALTTATLTTVEDRTTGGPSVCAQFAGRIFYAGFNGTVVGGDDRSPNLTNFIAFSQLVKSAPEIYKCYQEGDPTSRDASDIIDSDGGTIRIAGANKIVGMVSNRTSLIVFADNGVWSISGATDAGFTATAYTVSQLTEYGCTSPRSIVVDGERIMFWGVEGIYVITRDKFAQYNIESMTQTTIQSFYDSIPIETINNCRGVYDNLTKKISWLFREGVWFGDSLTRELVYDTTLNCFSLNRISQTADSSIEVVDVFFDDGRQFLAIRTPDDSVTQFVRAEYRDEEFRDWKTHDSVGVDAKAYVFTGSQIAGDSAVAKQTPYLVLHFRKTEFETNELGVPLNQSGALFRTQWDWSTSAASNKFSALSQGYRYRQAYFAALPDTTYDNGFETVTTKNKVRGRGKAFALYLETEPYKDCNFLGWNITINGNALA